MPAPAAIPAPAPATSPWRSLSAVDPGRGGNAAPAPQPATLCDFDPDPAETQRILALLVQPTTSLSTLAQHLRIGVGVLSLWLAREDIQALLTAFNAAAGTVTRAAAINQLPCVPIALGDMIRGHTADQSVIFKPCFATAKLKELQRANARKAAALLLRLARFDPSQPLARPRWREHSASTAPPSARSIAMPDALDSHTTVVSPQRLAQSPSVTGTRRWPGPVAHDPGASDRDAPQTHNDSPQRLAQSPSVTGTRRWPGPVAHDPGASDRSPTPDAPQTPNDSPQRLAQSPSVTGTRRWPKPVTRGRHELAALSGVPTPARSPPS